MSRLRRLFAALFALLLLTSCAKTAPEPIGTIHILATTYPIYLFTTAVTDGVDGVDVTLLINAQTSCLHDYTLTVRDMRAIDQADIIVMNGAGLEDFMADALAQSDATVIDCLENIDLLPTSERTRHDDHGHDAEYDPHYWMDPHRARQIVLRITAELSERDPDNTASYEENRDEALSLLSTVDSFYRDMVYPPYKLITFHNGFQYFADSFGFDLLKAIEEEEGATASASEIKEIVDLIEAYDIPAIFVEKDGSRKTADVIARETGCEVRELDMIMSGDGSGIQPYIDTMDQNLTTILEAFS